MNGSILHLVAWPMYVLLLWSLKTAMAVFYLRLMVSLILRLLPFFLFFSFFDPRPNPLLLFLSLRLSDFSRSKLLRGTVHIPYLFTDTANRDVC